MPVADPKLTINTPSMRCGGSATVTLGFRSAAGLATKPADIVLIMDRSDSMTVRQLNEAKAAARQFIDLVDGARDGATRTGLVSFAADATEDVALTTQFAALRTAIDALTPGGKPNYRAAFEAAGKLLNVPSAVRQVAVLFTAGEIVSAEAADSAVEALKAKGIEIFCIALAADPAPLNRWATDPDSIHAAYAAEPAQLEQAFRQIAAEVIRAGARDVVIRAQLSPAFKLVRIHTPAAGTARITDPQNLSWEIDAAGLTEQPRFTELSFDIMHIGKTGGLLPISRSVHYTDREGNTLAFPEPAVEVDCTAGEFFPEPCPEPGLFTVPGCQDAAHVTLPPAGLQGLGRIVQLDVTLKSVCPGKRVAASILLTETAPDGTALPRGVKHILVPAQTGENCKDIILKCVQFSLPEGLYAAGAADSICNSRSFSARVIANYVDTDFTCCEANVQMNGV